MWSDESWFITSVKGSAGGAVKWFAPFTCRSLSARAKVRCPSELARLLPAMRRHAKVGREC